MVHSDLGQVRTTTFKDFLILPLSKEWLSENNGKPLVFDAKLTKNGKLELVTSLSALASSKEVDTNAR